MPHLVILYTGQLDQEVNMTSLCRQLADAMLTVKDESGKQVFPTGGTRVLAYPAPHYAVADGGAAGVAAGAAAGVAAGAAAGVAAGAAAGVAAGAAAGVTAGGNGDYAFAYLNLRMGRGRTEATQKLAGDALLTVAKAFFTPLMATKHIGVTLQIDVGQEVFDAKHSNLHPLFNKA